MSARRTKARRRESFRCHAEDYPTRTPGWAKISASVTLGPEAWARLCALIGADDEGNALPEAASSGAATGRASRSSSRP